MNSVSTPSISVVVPVFNSESTLTPLIERVQAALAPITKDLEIILVNDGSTDESWTRIRELALAHPFVHGLNLMRNYGQHNALLAGIREARHEVIVTMDDDLQHPPEEIPVLLEKMAEGYEVVYGSPREDQHSLSRNLASQATKLFLRMILQAKIARKTSAFRAFRAPIREAFSHFSGPYVSIDVLLTWATSQFGHVIVRHDPRRQGQSQYTLRTLLICATNMIAGFSVLPLRIASLLGFVFMLFGMLILLYVLAGYALFGSVVHGFPFLASIIVIFSGVQLFCLGVIGEYVGYMHTRLLGRPGYALREKTE